MTTITLRHAFDLAAADADLLPYSLIDRVLAVSDKWDTVSVRSVSCGGTKLGFVVCLHPHPKRPWFRRPQSSLIMPWSEANTTLELQPGDTDGLNTALTELAWANAINTARGGTQ